MTRCLYRSENVLRRIVFGERETVRTKAGKRITLTSKAPVSSCVVWQFRDRLCTVQVGSTYYKRLWAPRSEVEYFRELCSQLGVRGNPSSYSWLWRKLVPRYSSRIPLAETDPDEWGYPWVEAWPPFGASLDAFDHARGQAGALGPQRQLPAKLSRWVDGPWTNYDIRCAYGWSVTQGLPDPREGKRVRVPSRRAAWGVYRVTMPLDGDRRLLPTCLRREHGHAWITREEFERWSVSSESVTEGVEYKRTWDLRPTIDTLRKLLPDTVAKAVVRTGWGGWHSDAPLVQAVYKAGRMISSHELRPLRQPELSSHVLGRVNARLAEVCEGSAHVFVDSAVTRDRLQLGNDWGQWRQDGSYPAIFVDGAGRWFAPDGPVRRAGQQWDAALARWNEIRRTHGGVAETAH